MAKTGVAYGKTVWSWHPLLMSTCAEAKSAQPGSINLQSANDGDKTNSSPGRARHKPSNHCAGNAGLPPLNLYARVRISLCNLAHETAGAACTRHSLLPLLGRNGRNVRTNLGQTVPRESGVMFEMATQAPRTHCHPPRMRGIQYAAASRLKHCGLWNTGSPGQAGRRRVRVKLNPDPSPSSRTSEPQSADPGPIRRVL